MRQLTLAAAAAMPADRFEFVPWEGSLSFAEGLRHIASAERTLVRALQSGQWEWQQGIARKTHPDGAAVQGLLRETAQELQDLLEALPEADLTRTVRVPWGESTPAELVIEWLVHEAHHRGQLFLHLRLCGVTPPKYY